MAERSRRCTCRPTLLLLLQRLLDAHEAQRGEDAAAAAEPPWLQLARTLFPRLESWYGWFKRTQAGAVPHSFRWRGRDADDGKLNAMTLASGLDDYP